MMKLRSSLTSPFVRKVRVVAIETGQDKEIELLATVPADPAARLSEHNPLSKVPALVLDDGSTLYDSRVICEYLDSRHQGRKLFPAAGPQRWNALRQQALADGMMDAAVLRMMESRRSEPSQRSADWEARQKLKMEQGLDALEKEAPRLAADLDIGLLSIAIMLDYFDFRFHIEDWRRGRSALAKWHQGIGTRSSFSATMPRD